MRIYLFMPFLFLAACALSSGVVPVGNDVFMISRSEKFGVPGSSVKAAAIQEADKYCGARGKQIELVTATQQDMEVFRAPAQAEIQFRCVPINK